MELARNNKAKIITIGCRHQVERGIPYSSSLRYYQREYGLMEIMSEILKNRKGDLSRDGGIPTQPLRQTDETTIKLRETQYLKCYDAFYYFSSFH